MSEEPAAEPPKKLTLKERLKAHFKDYGSIAIYTYLALSLTAIIGFSIAIGMGVGASSASGVFGSIGAGWVAAKATMPLRILATLGLTPLIAALLNRRRKRRGDVEETEETEAPATESAKD
jgi:hypothetical protein